MALVQGSEYPEHLFYDVDNQIWYEALADGTVRAGFTPWAVKLMGEVLVFTPKRIGRDFEKERSFAVIEGGKWVGAARAAFDGTVVSHNELLMQKPERLSDALRQRLDAHRAARARRLARRAGHRPRDRAGIRSLDRRRAIQGEDRGLTPPPRPGPPAHISTRMPGAPASTCPMMRAAG